eukprot:5503593-Pyramimonas_sp.AAC.1
MADSSGLVQSQAACPYRHPLYRHLSSPRLCHPLALYDHPLWCQPPLLSPLRPATLRKDDDTGTEPVTSRLVSRRPLVGLRAVPSNPSSRR